MMNILKRIAYVIMTLSGIPALFLCMATWVVLCIPIVLEWILIGKARVFNFIPDQFFNYFLWAMEDGAEKLLQLD